MSRLLDTQPTFSPESLETRYTTSAIAWISRPSCSRCIALSVGRSITSMPKARTAATASGRVLSPKAARQIPDLVRNRSFERQLGSTRLWDAVDFRCTVDGRAQERFAKLTASVLVRINRAWLPRLYGKPGSRLGCRQPAPPRFPESRLYRLRPGPPRQDHLSLRTRSE